MPSLTNPLKNEQVNTPSRRTLLRLSLGVLALRFTPSAWALADAAPLRVITLFQGATDSAVALGITPCGIVDSWTRVDVGARYAFKVEEKNITLRANVENVADKRYWSSAGASDDSEPGLTLATPRTYRLSATVDF